MNLDPDAGARAASNAFAVARAFASRFFHATGLAVLVSVLSTLALSAWAQTATPMTPAASTAGPVGPRPGIDHPMESSMGHPPGGFMGHHMGGMDGGMGGMGGMTMLHGSPERMGRMIDLMLDGLGATEAQRAQIKQIATAAASDLKIQHESGQAMRQRAMQLFTAPTIDAGAVEKTRQQALAQHDQASKRLTQALLDVARVLTPEQRARLGERLRDRIARMQDRTERMQKMEQEHPRAPR